MKLILGHCSSYKREQLMNYNLDYKELYNNFPSGNFCSLPNGTIVHSNKKLLDLTNYTREEVIGEKSLQIFFLLGEKYILKIFILQH
jgi:PAS domain-containing protein